ncbi:MAG: DEAD/DEAH box helicase [Deltaproteobacteria bacterium]|nr:DEAD/DEAH box helicase [Deltaproteobacteria bacterium]
MSSRDKPLIVQSDGSVLLEVMSHTFEDARDAIQPFAELIKSPEYVHTYRITPLSIWNAAASGFSLDEILNRLESHSRYAIPQGVEFRIRDSFSRWDAIRLLPGDSGRLNVEVASSQLHDEIVSNQRIQNFVLSSLSRNTFSISAEMRGRFKHALIKEGYPANDLVGYESGAGLELQLRKQSISGQPFLLRQYQAESVDNFWAGGGPRGGQGVVVLPCGAGKTIVGMGVMERARTHVLILCTNVAAVHQWISELIDKTTLESDQIGEYTGARKEIRPVTVSTYQMLTYRKSKLGEFEHMKLLMQQDWGLIIYDEVHVLPAPVFRATTEIQAKRRLGLTATLIREDGLEEDTFSLIGPKCYDVPWKELEQKGFIAEAVCYEIRLPLPAMQEKEYALQHERAQFRIASENLYKDLLVKKIINDHADESILVIGQYISQLKRIASLLGAPLITGSTSNGKRDLLYQAFRQGDIPVMVVSKVANFAIDLPDASVAVQVSGTFGSRQEEAQRLGRILRPKKRVSTFYTLVSARTSEEDFAHKRQVFLAEQGYTYKIEEWSPNDFYQSSYT